MVSFALQLGELYIGHCRSPSYELLPHSLHVVRISFSVRDMVVVFYLSLPKKGPLEGRQYPIEHSASRKVFKGLLDGHMYCLRFLFLLQISCDIS
ncbi:unnamed protein product [Cuscuta campestris]|uniref:Uncharacterized protein n=1 Tax=Cuscuta campestris TaxID=132261 RepID=A0A484LCH9_9ASTE|nr:unnamed protein product [Cuscuta campestris]